MTDYTTYGIPYMGSKKKLIPFIFQALEGQKIDKVVDLFTGTTRVAQAFRKAGSEVTAVDLSQASSNYSALFLELSDTSILQPYLDQMNKLQGYEGWFTENYHGDRTDEAKGDSRFMQYKNTIKVDAARDYVETLDVDDVVKRALVGCILFAIPTVDNTIGQQQAYLKDWCSRSYKDIEFKIPGQVQGPKGTTLITSCFNQELTQLDPDLVYIDPPYSKNVWYPSYYHIYDSVAIWDKPETVGKAKRRIDRSSVGKKQGIEDTYLYENDLWYKDDQTEAFTRVLDLFPKSNFLISYSSDSALSKYQMMQLLGKYGEVSFYSVDYKTNALGFVGSSVSGVKIVTPKGNVKEYLFSVKR